MRYEMPSIMEPAFPWLHGILALRWGRRYSRIQLMVTAHSVAQHNVLYVALQGFPVSAILSTDGPLRTWLATVGSLLRRLIDL